MPTYKSYQAYLVKSLEDPVEAADYLNAVLEDGEFEHILLALQNVAEAQRKLVTPSGQSDTNWEMGNLPRLNCQRGSAGFSPDCQPVNQLRPKALCHSQ